MLFTELSALTNRPNIINLAYHLLFSSGFQANILYRFSHLCYRFKIKIGAKIISRINLFVTGADISFSAKIGKRLYIPHSYGIVIGSTSIIGDNVTILHGVTLGSKDIVLNPTQKRHPTIGDNVLIGSNVAILGDIYIGNNVKIGSNAVVTKNITDNSIVVGVNRIIEQ